MPASYNPSSRVTRPSKPGKQVSYLRDGAVLHELVLNQAGKLQFATREGGEFVYSSQAESYTAPEWLQGFAQGGTVALPSQAEPYETIDALAEAVRTHIHRYFDCPQDFESVAVLFVLMTWLPELFHAVPYLRFLGVAGTGKSRGSEVIGSVCYRRLGIAGAATPASMYHLIENVGGTLVIDEADFAHSGVGTEIAKILNCGYQRGSQVVRMEKTKEENWEPRAYEVFGPKIINGRARFQDDATESRCLTLVTEETEREDIPTQLLPEFHSEALALRNQLLAFRYEYLEKIQSRNVHVPGIGRRTNQIILPLLLIAEALKDPRYTSDLMKCAGEVDAQTKQDRGDSLEAALVTAYGERAAAGPAPTCGEVYSQMLLNHPANGGPDPELKSLSARRVSSMAKTLGFTTTRANRGAVLSVDGKQLKSLCERFSIVTQPAPQSSPASDEGDEEVTINEAA